MPSPTPTPRFVTFFLSSRVASSSSSLNSALARSATSLAVAPRPFCSVAGVCMAPPVDDLGQQDSGGECRADDHERARPALHPGRLGPAAELGAGRRDGAFGRLLVHRGFPF